jgi:hypothetical protein
LKAKSPVQNFIGSNGYFGCSFCEQEGRHSESHYFPFKKGLLLLCKLLSTFTVTSNEWRTKETVESACQILRENINLEKGIILT